MAWRDRLRRANGTTGFHIAAALGIAATLAIIVMGQAWLLGWRDIHQLATLAAIYAVAGLGGTFIGSWMAAFLTERGPRAFAAWAMLSGGLTMAFGALIFALAYRSAYAQWHAPVFTVGWAFQSIFTMAGAVYFWAVLGTRMILPWAIVPLAAGALAFARRVR